jgi:hypothetical protein
MPNNVSAKKYNQLYKIQINCSIIYIPVLKGLGPKKVKKKAASYQNSAV